MSNALYDSGRQKFLEGNIAWLTDNIKVALIKTGLYTVNLATHQFLSDIPGAAIAATSPNLASKTSAAGVANAATAIFALVSAGIACNAVVIYKDTGVSGTSPLIAYIDTATGLPVTTNGADVDVVWDTGANKIFKL